MQNTSSDSYKQVVVLDQERNFAKINFCSQCTIYMKIYQEKIHTSKIAQFPLFFFGGGGVFAPDSYRRHRRNVCFCRYSIRIFV